MSEEIPQGKSSRIDEARRSPTIDLDKAAVTDVTPIVQTDAEPAAAPEASPEPPPAPAEPALPESSPPEVAAAPTQARKSGGMAAVASGAVAGAIFGLLGAVVYQNIQKPPVTVADPQVREVEARIAAVDRKTAEAGAAETRLRGQLGQVEARAGDVERLAAELGRKTAALEERSAALEQKANALEQKAQAVEQKAVLNDQRAAALEQQAAGLVKPVEDRIKAAEARLAEARDQAGAINKRIDLLAQIEPPKVDLRPVVTRLDELERTIGSNAARTTLTGEAATALDGRLKSVEQGLKGAETGIAGVSATIKGVDGAVKETGERARALEAAMAEIKARLASPPAGGILAVAGLARRALDLGEPLGSATAAFASLGVAEATLQPLQVYAQTPPRRLAQLADFYTELAASAPKPAAPPPPKADGVIDRLTSGLWSQVEVRKVGSTPAADPGGIGGQVRQRVLAGDLSGALDLIKGLSAEQQSVLKPFVDRAGARIAALRSLRTIEGEALAAAQR